ncbi:MAG: GNAT family N-acetyltransferase [Bacteroidota bacterium]
MKLSEASRDDLPNILLLQKDCYQEEAELYDEYEIPPLTQTVEEINADFGKEQFFKIEMGDKIVGSVRLLLDGTIGKIGRLIVHKDYRNQGLGTKMMNHLESIFPTVNRFELFTGHRSERNLYLYKKLGYKEYKRQRMNDKLELIFLEKIKTPEC